MGIGSIDIEFNFQMFNHSNLDLFATRFSHKLPLCAFPVLDNQAFAIDAFSMNWNNIHAYAFPTTILTPSVLNKICQFQCRMVLIAPLWPAIQCFGRYLNKIRQSRCRMVHIAPLLARNKHGSQRFYNYLSRLQFISTFFKLLTQAKESFNIEISQYSTITPGSYQAII